MRIYVISLVRSDARRKRIRDQLERLGCAYELFSAIDGADGRNYFDRLDEKRYLLNTGRVPSDGEKHGRPLFALSPPVVWGGEPRHASTIAGRDRAPERPALRAQRALTKIHSSVARACFNLRHRSRREKVTSVRT